jgi:signal transduction histidine kinase
MATLAAIIDRYRDEIMNRWAAEAQKAAAARGLSQPELRSALALYLSSLGGLESATEQLQQHLQSYVASRIRQGFDVSEVVEEFTLLEQCFNSLRESMRPADQPSEADREHLSTSIQRTIVWVTELFHEHLQLDEQREKRYLRLLQAVADEALRAPEAPFTSRLGEVLELVMEAMGAEAASLLLYDPEADRLLTASSAGAAGGELEQFAISHDRYSLDGPIASYEEHTALADVATNEPTVSDSLRHSGLHSLLRIRLPPYRKLLGVLYIGLREERRFTPREVRRVEALGDRLMLQLDNAKLYAELFDRIEDLQIESQLREQFVAILAHDLRGPLSVAKVLSQLLLRYPERLDQRRELAIRIEHNLDRIERMIRDLLDVSRVRAGKRLPLRLDWCDLGAVAEEVVEELSAAHGARFGLVAPETVRGIWSSEELRRALWNMGVNAIKYGARDTPITVQVERTRRGARVSVHNLGKPIPAEDQARLFDLYSTLRTRARPGGGWGLGLALVRACAEAHGGKAEVQSGEAGTTFSIDLPADSRPIQPSARGEERAGTSGDGDPHTTT